MLLLRILIVLIFSLLSILYIAYADIAYAATNTPASTSSATKSNDEASKKNDKNSKQGSSTSATTIKDKTSDKDKKLAEKQKLKEEELRKQKLLQEKQSMIEKIGIKYGLKADILDAFNSHLTETKLTSRDKTFVIPKNATEREIYIETYYDRPEPIVMSHIDIKQDASDYKTKYFSNYQEVGSVKMIYKKLSINEIKGFGAYINANLIIMKKFFEPTLGKYVYDIIFLNGAVEDKANYWYRIMDEASAVQNSLNRRKIKDINSYDNVIKVLINSTDSAKKTVETPSQNTKSPEASADSSSKIETPENSTDSVPKEPSDNEEIDSTSADEKSAENSESSTASTAEQSSSTPAVAVAKVVETQKNENDKTNNSGFSPEELYKLQKALVAFRVEKLIGVWEDVHTKEQIEIRVLNENSDETKVTYAGYTIDEKLQNDPLESIDLNTIDQTNPAVNGTTVAPTSTSAVPTTAPAPSTSKSSSIISSVSSIFTKSDKKKIDPRINKNLKWLYGDYKMQFSLSARYGMFVDSDKMLEQGTFYLHPAKGLLIIALPNNEFRYYRPVLEDIMPELSDKLYLDIEKSKNVVDQNNIKRFYDETSTVKNIDNFMLGSGIIVLTFTALIILFF